MPPDPFPTDAPPAVAPLAPPRRSRLGLWLLLILGIVLGAVAMFYAAPLVARWTGREAAAPPVAATAVAPSAAATPAVPVGIDSLAAREAALDAQLRSIEGRAAAADVTSRNAASNAARSEGMLVTFAVRRAIDRGLPLGYLEGELNARFVQSEPRAVAAIIRGAREPVTREDLRIALDAISPRLTLGSTRDGVWKTIRGEIANLVVLRRAATPSPRPADRLTRARRMIEADNVEAALAEVEAMPGASAAEAWLTAARRYVLVRRALDRLELAALRGRVSPAVAVTTPVAPVAVVPPVVPLATAPVTPPAAAPSPVPAAPAAGASPQR